MPIKVFVGNLRENCSQESIEDLFSPYGKLNEISVLGKFAFVHFEKKEDADRAVKELNQSLMFGQNIIVEISKKQGGRPSTGSNSDRKRQDRPPNRRGSDMRPNAQGPVGGILGLGPTPPNPLAPLNLLSQMNSLNALGTHAMNNDLIAGDGRHDRNDYPQRDRNHPQSGNYNSLPPMEEADERPDPDVRVRREVVHTRDIPEQHRAGLGDGYVIHERYYVDPSHSLLRGLRLSDLPRIGDPYLARDAPRADREYNSTPSYRDIDRQAPLPRRDGSGHIPVGYSDLDGRDRSPLSMRENPIIRERDYLSRDYSRIDPYSRR